MTDLKISYFFRKPIVGQHSIEELFRTIISQFDGQLNAQKIEMPFISKGIGKRCGNIFYSLFHQGDINHITGDIHYIALLLKKKKTVLTIHDIEIIHRKTALQKKLIVFFWFWLPIKRVRYVTVISEFTKQELLKHIKADPLKIHVIPNCLPGKITFTPKQFNEICPRILVIGTKENKNLNNIIPSLRGLICKLIVIGQLSDSQKNLLRKHNVSFEMYTSLAYNEVLDVYKLADMLLFASTYEGFGLPILEAQALGRPVITSSISSMPEVAGDGALFVDPFNEFDIRKAVKLICNDPGLRIRLIALGLENVKRFDSKTISDLYLNLYKTILD